MMLETAVERVSQDNHQIHQELARLRAQSAELQLLTKNLRLEATRPRDAFAVRVADTLRARSTPTSRRIGELTAGTSEAPHQSANPLSFPSRERRGR